MNDFLRDISFAWRNVLKRPAFSLLIILTLALGIGANAAMFSVAYRVLLAPLPFADGERLVTLEQRSEFTSDIPWQPPTLEDFRAQTTVFADLLGYVQLEYPLLGQGEPYFATVGIVNDDYFGVLGIEVLHGRGFAPEDNVPDAAPAMLLGHAFWQSKFGGAADVIGRSLEMNGVVYTVVGVLPPLPAWPRTNAVWITWAGDSIMGNADFVSRRSDVSSGIIWSVIGKLNPGATPAAAQREVDAVAASLKEQWPDTVPPDYHVVVHDLATVMRGDSGKVFALLLGLSLLVLIIACANVANLHLARLAMRGQELAVREAVGASPARILWQLLGESLVYAVVAGIAGLGLAWPALLMLDEYAAIQTPLAGNFEPANVLVPTFGVAVAAGLCSGLLGAFGRRDINSTLKEGGTRVTVSAAGLRRRRVLLVLQLGLSFVMLTTSTLMLLSVRRLDRQHPGYEVDGVLAANFQLNSSYPGESQAIAFSDRLLEGIAALPGVQSTAIAGAPLLRAPLFGVLSVVTEGDDDNVEGSAFNTVVAGDYFGTVGIPLLRGRGFSLDDDIEAPPVAVVNANFERVYFPRGALGRRVSFNNGQTWRTIVGVVGNVRPTALDREEGPNVYTPYRQRPTSLIHLFVRSSGNLDALGDSVTDTIHTIDPGLALEDVRPLEALRAEWLAPRALVARLIAGAGLLALLISCAGVVGIVSYGVSQRVREIGVRMAMGAAPGNILRLFMLQGLRSHAWGLLLGLLLMLAAASLLEPLLYRTTGFEPFAWLASAMLLSVTVLLAVYLPAIRASALDPVVALHHE